MVRTNLFYHALKHCIGGWESILISYLYYVLFNREAAVIGEHEH